MHALFLLSLVLFPVLIFAQPVNDDCVDAVPLPVLDVPCSIADAQVGNNTGGTTDFGGGYTTGAIDGCLTGTPASANISGEVWYTVTVPASGELEIVSVRNGGGARLDDPAMMVFSGGCATRTLVACDDNSGPGGGGTSALTTMTGLVPGQTLHVALLGSTTDQGQFLICARDPNPPPPNNDCINATGLCNTASFADNVSGPGANDISGGTTDGCLNGENQAAWYRIRIGTPGVLEFVIEPVTTSDYDFAVWGPITGCTGMGAPIRCSYDAPCSSVGPCYETGLNSSLSGGNDSEGAGGGTGYVNSINVNAGEEYAILIDNFSTDFQGFTLDFGGTTATLDCSILPVEYETVFGYNAQGLHHLEWHIAREDNTHRYDILQLVNERWLARDYVPASGKHAYSIDLDPFLDQTRHLYYIQAVDYDGRTTNSNLVEILPASTQQQPRLDISPNPIHRTARFPMPAGIHDGTPLVVYDNMGREVHRQVPDTRNESVVVDLANLPPALYIFQYGSYAARVLKQ